MILEFVGVPGVGKTTVASATSDRLESEGLSVNQPTTKLTHQYSTTRRLLSKTMFAAQGTVTSPSYVVQASSTIGRVRQTRKRMYLKNLFNVLFLKGVYRSSNPKETTVLDQGMLQALWSIAYFARNDVSSQDLLPLFLTDDDQSVEFVLIEAPVELTRDRLATRDTDSGHPDELEQKGDVAAQSISRDSYELTKMMAKEIADSSPNISVSVFTNTDPEDVSRISQVLTTQVRQGTKT